MTALGIVLITMLVIFIAYVIVNTIFQMQTSLGRWINQSSDPLLFKFLALPLWILLTLMSLIFVIIGVLCGIQIAHDVKVWWRSK